MSKEIAGYSTTGTLYARLRKTSNGKWWNGTTLEDYSASNYSNYDIAMTEEGNSGVYVADFPILLTTSGTYEYFVHLQSGGSPVETDRVINTGKIDWTGTTSVSAASGSMTGSDWRDYVLRCGFKRTDKDTELYEATTDAIQECRRLFMFDEAEAEITTTDTISVLGDFKIAIEEDFGMVLGIVVEDGDTGTPLVKISKSEFDKLYSSVNVETDTGYPKHFCIYAGQIYIGPTPDRVTYAYRISYSKRAGTITSSTSGVPFTNLYRDMLCDNVLFRLYKGLEEFDKSNYYLESFKRYFSQAESRENLNSGRENFNVRIFSI